MARRVFSSFPSSTFSSPVTSAALYDDDFFDTLAFISSIFDRVFFNSAASSFPVDALSVVAPVPAFAAFTIFTSSPDATLGIISGTASNCTFRAGASIECLLDRLSVDLRSRSTFSSSTRAAARSASVASPSFALSVDARNARPSASACVDPSVVSGELSSHTRSPPSACSVCRLSSRRSARPCASVSV